METVQEILPFAREMLGQGANRRMFRVYFVGAAVAVLGTALGLLESICQPFSFDEPLDEELSRLALREKSAAKEQGQNLEETEALTTEPKKLDMQVGNGRRNSANRLHAS
ncbi:G0/G1 switch protein 2-like [Scleropages formosus]|uniref:G0/G1 switch protein 2-like n=1 Tax=Scleropages formosus TaxID=113540 RepID=UPI000878EE1F|nr:G0/G1 switch protein 2 [Scleropages formosus]